MRPHNSSPPSYTSSPYTMNPDIPRRSLSEAIPTEGRDLSEETPLIRGKKIGRRYDRVYLLVFFTIGFFILSATIVTSYLYIRLREEKWRREEEERERPELYWGELIADPHCTGYNTREYWARLWSTVPNAHSWLMPCEDIPITIHGRTMKTTRCWSNPYVSGEVFGHWLVDFDEPLCTPFWERFEDKGCTAEGSGRHRYLAHLVNVHDGEDREKLCASTPIDFHGRHFDSPHSCVNQGNEIYGFWESDDSNC